jgi:hypothetical protein
LEESYITHIGQKRQTEKGGNKKITEIFPFKY